MKKEKSFISSALILMFASVIVKLIGAIYKIPLTNLLGAEGMGIFSVAYNFYTILFVISTSGLPVAVAKMVASANATNKKSKISAVVKSAVLLFGSIGLFLSFLMILCSRQFAVLVGNEAAQLGVLSIAPAIFFTALISVFRGYYQGLSNMYPTAFSQIIEAAGKLVLGYSLSFYLVKAGYSIEVCAAGAVFGVSFGTFLSAAFLVLLPRKYENSDKSSKIKLMKNLLSLSIPVALGASVLSLTGIIDMFQIMNRLQKAGFNVEMANRLYGAYNMSLTLANLPQAFVSAISISIIPVISSAFAKKDMVKTEENALMSLKITTLIAMPSGIGLSVLSKQILNMLYYKRPNDVLLATPILTLLGISVIFISLTFVSSAILQAISKEKIPLISMLIGALVKIIVSYRLMGDLRFHIYGAAIGSIFCYLVICVLNLLFVLKCKFLDFFVFFCKSAVCTGFMSLAIYIFLGEFMGKISENLIILLAICLGIVLYLGVSFFMGILTKKEILLFPFGERLSKFLSLE